MITITLTYFLKVSPNRQFLARDAFVKTNRRAVDMMFVRLSGTGVHCDHMVQFNADVSLWLDSLMFWTP